MGEELRLLLSRKPFLKQLIGYLQSSSSEENALCYESIQTFKDDWLDSPAVPAGDLGAPMARAAHRIYRQYLSPSAPMKVNLTASTLRPISQIFMTNGLVTRYVFDKAHTELYLHLKNSLVPAFQAHLVETIQISFATLTAKDVRKLTESTFATLYREHPEVKPLMQSVNMELKVNRLLRQVVDLFDNITEMVSVLYRLGRLHVRYNVESPQLLWFADSFLSHLPKAMRAIWTPQLESAWATATDIIVIIMACGLEDERAGFPVGELGSPDEAAIARRVIDRAGSVPIGSSDATRLRSQGLLLRVLHTVKPAHKPRQTPLPSARSSSGTYIPVMSSISLSHGLNVAGPMRGEDFALDASTVRSMPDLRGEDDCPIPRPTATRSPTQLKNPLRMFTMKKK